MDNDPFDLITQEQTAEKKAELEKFRRSVELDDVKWLMDSRQGRRVMWRLLAKTQLFHAGFVPAEQVQFANGMRNVGAIFWSDLHEACPEKYSIMVKEAKDDDDRIRARSQD